MTLFCFNLELIDSLFMFIPSNTLYNLKYFLNYNHVTNWEMLLQTVIILSLLITLVDSQGMLFLLGIIIIYTISNDRTMQLDFDYLTFRITDYIMIVACSYLIHCNIIDSIIGFANILIFLAISTKLKRSSIKHAYYFIFKSQQGKFTKFFKYFIIIIIMGLLNPFLIIISSTQEILLCKILTTKYQDHKFT